MSCPWRATTPCNHLASASYSGSVPCFPCIQWFVPSKTTTEYAENTEKTLKKNQHDHLKPKNFRSDDRTREPSPSDFSSSSDSVWIRRLRRSSIMSHIDFINSGFAS